MKSQIINVTAPLHVIGAFVRGDKDVVLPIDIVQTVGNSPVDLMSQQAVSKAISEGILFETYNREQIDQKDFDTLVLATKQHEADLNEYNTTIRKYINDEDIRFLDEYRQYAHTQDLYYKDLTTTELKEYTDEVVKQIRLFNIKGRVDTFEELPEEDNQPFDMYLVGPESAKDFTEYYWLTTLEPHHWEQLGVVSSDIPLDEYYSKVELDPKLLIINTNVSLLQEHKVDKVTGKQLSTEDFTTEYKTLLSMFTADDITEMLTVNASEAARRTAEELRVEAEELRETNTTEAINSIDASKTAALEAAAAATEATTKADTATANADVATKAATDASTRSNTLSDNQPKVINGEWWVYDEELKDYKNTNLTATGNVQYATFDVDLSNGILSTTYDPTLYKGAEFVIEDGILKAIL